MLGTFLSECRGAGVENSIWASIANGYQIIHGILFVSIQLPQFEDML